MRSLAEAHCIRVVSICMHMRACVRTVPTCIHIPFLITHHLQLCFVHFLMHMTIFFLHLHPNAKKTEDTTQPAIEELDPAQYPGGHLTIYYGSQTGTAESFAQQIAREGDDHGFKVHVVDLEDVTEDAAAAADGDLSTAIQAALMDPAKADANGCSRAVFLMATYGEGEPTDNAAQFVALLKDKAGITSNYNFEAELEAAAAKKAAAGSAGEADYGEEKKGEFGDDDNTTTDAAFFNGLSYAVFALGNRQYEHFCAMGKLTDAALGVTGADRLAEVGIGDDDNDLEGDFENWKDTVMWPTLKKRFVAKGPTVDHKNKSKVGGGGGASELPDCPYEVEFLDGITPAEAKADVVKSDEIHASTRHYFTAVDCPVRVSRELRPSRIPVRPCTWKLTFLRPGMICAIRRPTTSASCPSMTTMWWRPWPVPSVMIWMPCSVSSRRRTTSTSMRHCSPLPAPCGNVWRDIAT